MPPRDIVLESINNINEFKLLNKELSEITQKELSNLFKGEETKFVFLHNSELCAGLVFNHDDLLSNYSITPIYKTDPPVVELQELDDLDNDSSIRDRITVLVQQDMMRGKVPIIILETKKEYPFNKFFLVICPDPEDKDIIAMLCSQPKEMEKMLNYNYQLSQD